MRRFCSAFLVGGLALLLAGCGGLVKAEVSRFSSFSTATSGNTFLIVPLDKQNGSVEFRTYASSVARRLKERGFFEVGDLGSADYAVIFDYGVSGSRQVTSSTPIYGQAGGGTTYTRGTVSVYGTGGRARGTYSGYSHTAPTYGVIGSSTDTETVNDRFFYLKIFDVKKSTDDNLVGVYEGTVKSSGSSATFAVVSECLMDALFDEFFVTGTDRITLNGWKCMR